MSQLDNFLLPSHFYSIAPQTVKLNAVFIIQSSHLNKCLLMSGKVFPSLVLIVAIHGCHHHGCYIHPGRIKRAFFPTTAADSPLLLRKAQRRQIFMTHAEKKNIAEICHKTKKNEETKTGLKIEAWCWVDVRKQLFESAAAQITWSLFICHKI